LINILAALALSFARVVSCWEVLSFILTALTIVIVICVSSSLAACLVATVLLVLVVMASWLHHS
jgi:hypothetical protein